MKCELTKSEWAQEITEDYKPKIKDWAKKNQSYFLLFKESVYSHHLVLDSGLFI